MHLWPAAVLPWAVISFNLALSQVWLADAWMSDFPAFNIWIPWEKVFVALGWHIYLRTTAEPQNELILTVLAEVLYLGWDKGSTGCVGWGTKEISFYKHYCGHPWETGRHEWGLLGKENNQFPHLSPRHPWTEKKWEEWDQGGSFTPQESWDAFLMKGSEGQSIKSVHCSGSLVGRRQQEFGRDVMMLCRKAHRRGKQFPCFLCQFTNSLMTL